LWATAFAWGPSTFRLSCFLWKEAMAEAFARDMLSEKEDREELTEEAELATY